MVSEQLRQRLGGFRESRFKRIRDLSVELLSFFRGQGIVQRAFEEGVLEHVSGTGRDALLSRSMSYSSAAVGDWPVG